MSGLPSHCVYIALGSNLDEPQRQVRTALAELDQLPATRCTACSSLYRSSPLGPAGQADYINAVARLNTELDPYALLDELQELEERHQRVRNSQRWGPRTLDLDLIAYDQQIINDARLNIPHPHVGVRNFVLAPLCEIDPGYVLADGRSATELLQRIGEEGLERLAPP